MNLNPTKRVSKVLHDAAKVAAVGAEFRKYGGNLPRVAIFSDDFLAVKECIADKTIRDSIIDEIRLPDFVLYRAYKKGKIMGELGPSDF